MKIQSPRSKSASSSASCNRPPAPNLESIILYGSAASGEYETDYSNINLLVVLKDTSFSSLIALAPVVDSWVQQRRPAPMLITQDELERSADVFSIELMDMRRQHRVLFGVDVVASLQIPMVLHRAQLEYELREKLISAAAAPAGGLARRDAHLASAAALAARVRDPISPCADHARSAGAGNQARFDQGSGRYACIRC